MNAIAEHLKQTMGFDPASISMGAVQRAVRERMRALGLFDIEIYRGLLAPAGPEWKALVESVVIRETWFFRDEPALKAFAVLALEEWLPRHPGQTLRVLSLPCSSGEEPYSLAMTLAAAGVPAERFEIDAVDISAQALAKARKGLYTKNSFRGNELLFRRKFFTEQHEGFQLKPAIREKVKFSEGNLLSPEFPPPASGYDFIFCRNLLIYFGRPTQTRAINNLRALLSSGGLIFVGPAEQTLLLDNGFESANIAMAFACRYGVELVAGPCASRPNRLATFSTPGHPAFAAGSISPPFEFSLGGDQTGRPAPQTDPAIPLDLQTAQNLLRTGRFDEAIAVCESYLRRFGHSAPAWHLLGVIRDAMSDPQARECYRRALYLEPDHYESLVRMAVLSQRSGQLASAQVFRARAERLKPGPNPT